MKVQLEVFLACGGNFRCWLKADTSSVEATNGEAARKNAFVFKKKLFYFQSAFRVVHYKDLTETGNCAREVPATQGNVKTA